MLKLIHLILLIFLIACGSETEFQEIMINKTVKVFSEDYHENADNYIFKWEPPIGPSNIVVPFDLKNDMLIFSPDFEGEYEIHLSVTDISDEVIATEIFYFRAIPETLDVEKLIPITEIDDKIVNSKIKQPIAKPVKKKKIKKQSRRDTKTSPNKIDKNNYTIQVAAWPSLEEARNNQLILIEEGIDAYIQRYYRNEKDDVWYRVRVGNFNKKSDAMIIQKQIESIIKTKTWLDLLPS